MMTYKYERYFSHVAQFPWAITREKFEEIVKLARLRASGARFSDDELQARFGAATPRQSAASEAMNVAVIPIIGTIAYRAGGFEDSSGGASAQVIGRMLDRALADDTVKSILLEIDSPGGSVEGIPELAEKIFAGRAVKPITAIAATLAASAAYWLGSQATEFVMMDSGFVGSIGVYMVSEDWSAHLEKEGIKINAISYGENKLEGAFWMPMSDETRAHYKEQVDRIGNAFVKAVARGRGVSVADVKKNFGQGRVFDSTYAKKVGMVDRVATFDETVARMLKAKPATGARADVARAFDVPAALLESERLEDGATITIGEWQGLHGHVTPRDDGQRAQCGGPDSCAVCADERQQIADREWADSVISTVERL